MSGAQGFISPKEGLYEITIAGAAGGRGLCNTKYGRGLVVKYQTSLVVGSQFLVVVGQRGASPCGVVPDHPLCQDLPVSDEEVQQCEEEWRDSAGDVVGFAGGGGGGGASMLWGTMASGESYSLFPTVIAAGGGGTSRVLNYSIAETLTTLFNTTTVNCSNASSESCYQMLVDARPQINDAGVNIHTGSQGFRSTDTSPIAGVGGGFFPRTRGLSEDGQQLGNIEKFANGGFSCLRQSIFTDSEFSQVSGGFGGGGGSCTEGGAGGGYTGGDLMSSGNQIPGGGGYSTIRGIIDVPGGSFSWSEGDDGYVDILLAECGCVHRCIVYEEEDEFECVCPEDALLARDQSDCYKGI